MFDKRFKSHHDAEQFYKDLLVQKKTSQQDLDDYLASSIKPSRNAIYIHIPFCDKICSFCNMNRTLSTNPKNEYTADLLRQIKELGSKKALNTTVIEAVYFGGGTPTTLSPMHFKQIMQELRNNFKLSINVEITCETTLHNLTKEHIDIFNQIGINRLSVGIQTFQDQGRVFFNRTFKKAEVIEKLHEIKNSFKGILCIDKIYNYPGETKDMLLDDIRQIINLKIDSVSFYSLMIHDGSSLSRKYEEGKFCEAQDLLFHDLFINELLKTGDYELIELTKIVRKNCDSYQYMSIRNNNGNTIPLGKGAGGKIDAFHIYNMDFNQIMIAKSLDTNDDLAQALYGMLQTHVINKKDIELYLSPSVNAIIDHLKCKEYLTENEVNYFLTNKGIFYGNNIGGLLTRAFLQDKTNEGAKIR